MLLQYRPKTFLFIGLALLTGCGQHTVVIIDPLIKPYYDRFVELAATEHVPLSNESIIINRSPAMGVDELGKCSGDGMPIITILAGYWDTASDADREELVFHELGHCLLNRVHLDGTLPSGIPASIMSTFHFSGATYSNNRDYYIRELFLGPFL